MGRTTGIEWTDSTWNPVRGCTRVSEGCCNCYAESVAARFSGPGQPYEGLAGFKDGDARWTGELKLIENHLEDPIRWKEPKRIFVNSMSDLFHPRVTWDWLARIFDVMARANQHTYQILTKRPERMLEALNAAANPDVVDSFQSTFGQRWPPAKWWFGVSVENQETANARLPILARCPAALRFVSYEPALGPVDLAIACGDPLALASIGWVICGGESGSDARPMHPDWVRDARDLCVRARIPFFFKQWGEWAPSYLGDTPMPDGLPSSAGFYFDAPHPPCKVWKFGKRRAGARLDGVEWKEYPNV